MLKYNNARKKNLEAGTALEFEKPKRELAEENEEKSVT